MPQKPIRPAVLCITDHALTLANIVNISTNKWYTQLKLTKSTEADQTHEFLKWPLYRGNKPKN